MDVKAKQRLCYLACPLSFGGLGNGFAPRQLNRSAFLVGKDKSLASLKIF